MNLILFDGDELERPLPRSDRRARHILEVLRRQVGDTFDAGVIDGARGKATLQESSPDALRLSFVPTSPPPAPERVTLIVGLPRPQTARDILRDATSLGVAALHFAAADKAEPSYAQSTLWTSGEWRRHLIAGAEQAFDTRIPTVTHGQRLPDVIATLDAATARIACDNYEATTALGSWPIGPDAPYVIALGPERGWSDNERTLLRAQGFALKHLGPRVLRAETACVAALAILRAKLGLM